MSKVIPTSHFKKQHKRVKKNPCWHSILHGEVPLPDDHRSPWEYVINCFLSDEPIPDHFHEHSITLTAQQESQIKDRLGSFSQVEIRRLNLHFDGYNSGHLLLYTRTNQRITYLTDIGTRSDLF